MLLVCSILGDGNRTDASREVRNSRRCRPRAACCVDQMQRLRPTLDRAAAPAIGAGDGAAVAPSHDGDWQASALPDLRHPLSRGYGDIHANRQRTDRPHERRRAEARTAQAQRLITGPDDRQARQPGSLGSTNIEVRDQQFANPFAARTAADLVPRRHLGHRERTKHLPHSGPIIDRHQELALNAR